MRRWRLWALLALLVACGGEDAAEDRIVDDEPLAPHSPLVGTWTTTGTHEDFGAVDVVMELCQDGTLRMSVATDGGAQLNFPGVWRTEGETLVLEGEYFRPDNRSAVRWSIGADGALVLEDENGRSDEWQRSGD